MYACACVCTGVLTSEELNAEMERAKERDRLKEQNELAAKAAA
jgi:hypothetical protein